MAITLRYTPIDTNGKATELSYQEMNENLKSFFYSSSFDADTYTVSLYHLSGSTSQSIDLSEMAPDGYISDVELSGSVLRFFGSGSAISKNVDLSVFFDDTDTNIANADLSLTDNRVLNLDGNELVISASQGERFEIASSPDSEFIISGLPSASAPNVLGYDSASGAFSYYSTASFIDSFLEVQTLQAVTDLGNTTTNDIVVKGDLFIGRRSGSNAVVIGSSSVLTYDEAADITAVGDHALENINGGPNDAFGKEALRYAINATYNLGFGQAAGYRSQGTQNTFIGQYAGPYYYDVTGGFNTMISPNAGINLSGSSASNTVIGASAFYSASETSNNTIIGNAAGFHITSGSNNTLIGYTAGTGIVGGSYNTIIGKATSLPANLSNTIILADGEGVQRFYISGSGDAGLNTSTPEATLHVRAANNASASLLIETDSLGAAESGSARLDFRVADNENGYKKYAIIARNDGDGFGRGSLNFALSNKANAQDAEYEETRLSIASDGRIYMPFLSGSTQEYLLGYSSGSGELTFFTASAISGGGGASDTFYTANGTITGNRTVTFNNSALTFTGSLNSFEIYTNEILIPMTATHNGAGAELLVIANNRVFKTGSDAFVTPGGSDTQVQFNDGGSFGGDSGFVYDKTNNRLTISGTTTGTTSTPSLIVRSADTALGTGEVVGSLGFASPQQGTVYSRMYAEASATWTGGSYPQNLVFETINGTSTVKTLTLKNTGAVQLHDYGSGNNTGTAAKWLAVDSSGNVIEENAPSDLNIARPGTVDSAETISRLDGGQEWTYNTGTIPSSGQFTSAGVTTVGSITAIAIHYTSANAGNQFARLKRLCESGNASGTGTLAITDSSFNSAQAYIKQVTDTGTYFTVYLSNWSTGGGLTSLSNGSNYDFEVQGCPLRFELLDKSYNRFTLVNNTGGDSNLRLFAPDTASPGDHIIVELGCAGSNGTDKLYIQYVVNNSGATSTYDDRWNNVYVTTGASSTPEWLFVADTYQMALLEFRVTPTGNLALISADKVARPA